jgi:hypothetical protein
MDSRGSPERVFACHLSDQVDLRPWNLRSPRNWSAFPSPVQPESLPVPADHGFGLDDQQRLLPRVVEISQNADEESVGRLQVEFWGCARDYFELFPKKQDLELKLCL